jgi:hypothetical protein
MAVFIASYSKGQLKIQQTAFMLVLVVIFFFMVGLIYLSISLANLREKAQQLRDDEAKEIVRSISGLPELAFTSSSDCVSCIDFDKALQLSEALKSGPYENFWNFDFLMIEKIYPQTSPDVVECTASNYPDCNRLILISKTSDFGAAQSAFVTLARWDENMNYYRYELGRIHASGENVNK